VHKGIHLKALITGVTGFAGGHLAEHLLAEGDCASGTSLSADWPRTSPTALADDVPLIEWDIATDLSTESLAAIASFAPECIYHLAAISVPRDCGDEQPSPLARAVNVEGTLRVLRLAAALTTRPRVIFISSSHVYAPVRSDDAIVAEDAPLGPQRGYGKTKLAAEQAAGQLALEVGIELVIARSFQHLGPRQTGPMMLTEWITQVVTGADPIKVNSRGAKIDVCDVRDVARAYRLLALRGEADQVYNVGSGRACASGEVLDALLAQLASPPAVQERNPAVKHDPIADTTRLQVATGWQPTIPITQTVADALAWQSTWDASAT
jgi:GDP-4-dehydro-6-deoxy-D-mannose reductase